MLDWAIAGQYTVMHDMQYSYEVRFANLGKDVTCCRAVIDTSMIYLAK